jgi:AcrR family transcriptional regulator
MYALHRKDSLILTAVELLDELGVQGLSTRAIANRQGISEATLFRHYKSKNDLLLAMIDEDSKYDADIISTVEINKMSPRKAITFFLNYIAEYYENYPAITAIQQAYDVLSYDPVLADRIKKAFNTRIDFLKGLITEAKAAGEIGCMADSEKLSYIIWGSFSTICLNWRFGKYKFSLKEYVLTTLNMTLDAFAVK